MKNLTEIIRATVEIADLENFGWDFSQVYESVSRAQEISSEAAEQWEKENYVAIIDTSNDTICYRKRGGNELVGQENTGDIEQTKRDLVLLMNAGLLWDVVWKNKITFTVNVGDNNVRTNGTGKDGNINFYEAGIYGMTDEDLIEEAIREMNETEETKVEVIFEK